MRRKKHEAPNYVQRAAIQFLTGTKCRAPIEAVELGIRSLEDWTDILNLERESSATTEIVRTRVRHQYLSNLPAKT